MTRLLLVDASTAVCQALAIALQSHGFEVDSAASSSEALRAVRTNPPDLIVLDLALPSRQAFSFMASLKHECCDAGVLIFTSVATKELIYAAARAGAVRILLRSQTSFDDLVTAIHVALNRDQAGETRGDRPEGRASNVNSRAVRITHDDAQNRLKELKPIAPKSEVRDRLEQRSEMRAFSPTLTRLLSLTRNPESSIDSIVKTIRQDQSLAIRILKMANSSVYTRGDPVDTIARAVTRIGTAQIGQAVLNMATMDHFSDAIIGDVTASDYWEHAIATGLIASEITHQTKAAEPDVAFTMGLVHDIGRIMLADEFPEEYAECMSLAEELELPLDAVEKRLFGMTHAECMDRMLHQWRFPKDLIDPIVFHHASLTIMRRMVPRRLTEVVTLALADRYAQGLMLGYSGCLTLSPTVEMAETIKLEEHAILRLRESIVQETEDLKLSMLASSASVPTKSYRQRVSEQLGSPVNILFFGSRSGLDNLSFMCETLADSSADSSVAVIRIESSHDVQQLSKKLEERESETGAGRLPVIIIAPSALWEAAEKVFADRQRAMLESPVHIPRLIQQIASMTAHQQTAIAA